MPNFEAILRIHINDNMGRTITTNSRYNVVFSVDLPVRKFSSVFFMFSQTG